jgi:hypothetical protein
MAKLRMHTDITLDILDQTTIRLGAEFRKFNDKTCAAFDTVELDREVEARKRRQIKKQQAHLASANPPLPAECSPPPLANNNSVAASSSSPQSTAARPNGEGRRQKKFNLHTYKYHALGDYVRTIRQIGTTDSYSTERVIVHHSLIWRGYNIQHMSCSRAS